MRSSLISILVPLYNEEEFVRPMLERVLAAPLPEGLKREVIVVDDASTDGSGEIVAELAARSSGTIRLLRHARNQGKGAAIRTALEHARGEITIIQDADLEYDPREYPKLLGPLLDGKADVVYGSRFQTSGERRVLYFWHSIANFLITGLCNMVADLNLTDMETCYKAFDTSLLRSIPIRSNRFGFEPEITIKLARREVRIYEISINYHGRTYEEGKKIGFRDALQAIYVIVRYAFSRDVYKGSGPDILDTLSGAPRFNRWMADTIRPYVDKRVMEIGAGIGNLTRVLVPGRKSYVATDVDLQHLARLETRLRHRPNVRVCPGDLSRAEDFVPFAGQMDTVICLNVLEHIEDDMQGLRNIHAVLRPAGKAIILVPNDPEIYGTLDSVLGHYRRYTPAELRGKMEAAGFQVEKILEFNRISRPGWWLSGRVLKRTTLGRFQVKLFDSLVWLWRLVDHRLPWKPTSIIAVAVQAPIPLAGQQSASAARL
jgi:glycosyltransferase involved in cell wall biosynthesis